MFCSTSIEARIRSCTAVGRERTWKWFHFRYFSQQFKHNCAELSKSGKFRVVYKYCWTSCYSERPGRHVLLCPRCKQAAWLTPGTSSWTAAWVGNTSTSKEHSVSTTETLCQYHHLESIHLPVFFFTNVFICSKRLRTLPLQWQYHGVIDKTTKATPVYWCPNKTGCKVCVHPSAVCLYSSKVWPAVSE